MEERSKGWEEEQREPRRGGQKEEVKRSDQSLYCHLRVCL